MTSGGGAGRRLAAVHALLLLLLWCGTLAAALARRTLLEGVVPESPHRGGYLVFVALLAPLSLTLGTVLGWLVERLGGRPADALPRFLEVAGTALLLPFGLATLAESDPLLLGPVQGGLFLLMMLLRLAALLLQGRRALADSGAPPPGVVPAVTLGIPLVVYLGLFAWVGTTASTTGDEPYYLLVAQSLARDGDTLLDNQMTPGSFGGFYWRDRLAPQNMLRTGEGMRSDAYTTLFPVLLAPTVPLGARAGPTLAVILLTALLAWRVHALAWRAVGDAGAAFFAWAVCSLTLPVLAFSSQIYPETAAALLAVVLLEAVTAGQRGTPLLRPDLARGAAAALLLPLLKVRYLPVSVAGAIIAAWRSGKARRALPLLAGGVVAAALLLLADRFLLGGVLVLSRFPDADTVFRLRKLLRMGPTGLAGLVADREFGLLMWSPLWAAAPAGAWWALRRRGAGGLAPLLPAAAYLTLLLGHFGHLWYGGYSQPGRYLVAVLPLLAPFLAWAWKEGRGPVLYALAILGTAWSVIVSIPYFLVPAFRYNAADTTNNLLSLTGARLDAPLDQLLPSFVNAGAWTPGGVAAVLGICLVPSLLLVLGARRGGPDVAPLTAGVIALALIVAALGLGWRLGSPTRLLEAESLPHEGGKLHTGFARGPVRVFDGPGALAGEFLARGDRTLVTVLAGAKGAERPVLGMSVDGTPSGKVLLAAAADRYLRGEYRFEVTVAPGRHVIVLTVEPPPGVRAPVYVDRLTFRDASGDSHQ